MADKTADAPDLEAHPRGEPQKQRRTFAQRWKQSVDTTYADLICLLLCLNTGLCDSSAYNAWSCFLAMQTGNTIFLGLGASGQPSSKPWGWLKSLTSIASFFVGALIFSNVTRRTGARRRGTLFTSFMVQTILIVIAVALIEADLIPHTAKDAALTGGSLFLELIPIALLAFQSAGSITSSRALGYNEIPTVVLTSVYFDVASDPKLREKPTANAKRNRRVGGVVMLLVGAIAGGWLSRSSGGMQSALWMAAGFKFVIGVGWLFWRAEEK
ncbi:YoaK family protein [Aspergillus thermomutatus]|uniref:DUF1275 domain protein n=1 Tax=Aspergillus thermomutatus TaxID=41047 RepID=A0A397I115_ASPTH|nr:uncharacterized protein CDV56_109340 [Aspergillus thermomutatus]RHZ66520.1 hypothetical protein CDV56_109340 [Aspergillus thermomutatus]